jgi:hypothetical protein
MLCWLAGPSDAVCSGSKCRSLKPTLLYSCLRALEEQHKGQCRLETASLASIFTHPCVAVAVCSSAFSPSVAILAKLHWLFAQLYLSKLPPEQPCLKQEEVRLESANIQSTC